MRRVVKSIVFVMCLVMVLASAMLAFGQDGTTLDRHVVPDTPIVTNAWQAVSNRTDALVGARMISATNALQSAIDGKADAFGVGDGLEIDDGPTWIEWTGGSFVSGGEEYFPPFYINVDENITIGAYDGYKYLRKSVDGEILHASGFMLVVDSVTGENITIYGDAEDYVTWISSYSPTSSKEISGIPTLIISPIATNGLASVSALNSKADLADLNKLKNDVMTWTDFIVGDGIRVTITNYYGSLALPSLYIEQKMPADEDHTDIWYKVIWDERTRWNAFMTGDWATLYYAVTNDAAHAFGNYNSLTGKESPEGVLQISHPVIIFTDGSVSYEKCSVEVGGCTLWTVQTSGLTFDTNATSNDFFRIFDGEGKALFEVVQGTRKTVGAVATGANFNNSAFEVTYNTTTKPDLKVCTNLVNAQWFGLTNAPFVASHEYESVGSQHFFTITPVAGTKQMFATGSYEVGGDTYIKNHAPVSMSSIVIDGQQYSIAVETVNGKKLLVLTEE